MRGQRQGGWQIRKDVADSEKAGARGTPIFFIGLTEPNSSSIKEAIEGLLAASR